MEAETPKQKKIIVVGVVEHGMTLRINEMAEKHDAIVEYRDAEEGKEPYAIAEGFDPNPPKTTLPYTMAPYLSMLDDINYRMYKDFNLALHDGKPYSKYARSATQAELDTSKVGRNEPCPCNSGKKYKQCCLK
jgi:hypothetical protein